MFNGQLCIAKRPVRQDLAACIAFQGVSTPKTGHLLPESLQRFDARFRPLKWPLPFHPVFASNGSFSYLASAIRVTLYYQGQ
jgi:hypothetical protein